MITASAKSIEETKTTNKNEIIEGTFLFKNAISDEYKHQFIELYKQTKIEFYQPILKSGHSMHVEMTCFGEHWNPLNNTYSRRRANHDGRVARHIPIFIKELAKKYVESIFPYHSPEWDVGIFNYYRPASNLRMHRDNAESDEAMNLGHPIVSFSIGSPCIFRLGGFTRDAQYTDIELENGDILVIGGNSRLRYHGVPKIIKLENPPFKETLRGGRLNLTLRKK